MPLKAAVAALAQGLDETLLQGGGAAAGRAEGMADLQPTRPGEMDFALHPHAAPQHLGKEHGQQQGHHQGGKAARGLKGTDWRRGFRLRRGGAPLAPPPPAQLFQGRGAGQARQGEGPFPGSVQLRGLQHLQQIPGLLAQLLVMAPLQAATAGGGAVGAALAHQGSGHQQPQTPPLGAGGWVTGTEGLKQTQHLAVLATIKGDSGQLEGVRRHGRVRRRARDWWLWSGPWRMPPPSCRCPRW